MQSILKTPYQEFFEFMYQIVVYIPKGSSERVKNAMFEQGGGKTDHYEMACWQTEGVGQYKPREGAKPFLGKIGELHKEAEIRVEMICKKEYVKDVIQAMLLAHPYEEPAYYVSKNDTLS